MSTRGSLSRPGNGELGGCADFLVHRFEPLHSAGVHQPGRAAVEAVESLHAGGVGLHHVARVVEFVVEQHQRAAPLARGSIATATPL